MQAGADSSYVHVQGSRVKGNRGLKAKVQSNNDNLAKNELVKYLQG